MHTVSPPPTTFNFAQHLIATNASRGDKVALIDDVGQVTYGQLTDAVRRFASGNSHIPECAGFTVPAAHPLLPLAHHAPVSGEPPLRPLHLMDPPQIVQVIAEVPDGPPRRFRWRRQVHDITAYEGPERLSAEWWKRRDGAGLTRDYYRVEDHAGRRFWLFRDGPYRATGDGRPADRLHPGRSDRVRRHDLDADRAHRGMVLVPGNLDTAQQSCGQIGRASCRERVSSPV